MPRTTHSAKSVKTAATTAPSAKRTKKPGSKAPAKTVVGKHPTTAFSSKPAPSKKRTSAHEPTPAVAKRLKPDSAINSALSKTLDVFVFGSGESGELGLGPKATDGKQPTDVQRPRINRLLDAKTVGVVQIAVGGMHCVSLTQDQKILTWGVNDNGALGRDTDLDSEDEDEDSDLSPKESTPTAIPTEFFGKGVEAFVQVAATDSASFALTHDGSVYGWGTFSGDDGIMGLFTADAIEAVKRKDDKKKSQRKPARIPQLTKIKSLAIGTNHILALDIEGKVYAWGAGGQSQLGRRIVHRTRFQALTPCRFGLPQITYIAIGAYHSFAIDVKGQVYAWGLNNFGQTGIMIGAGEDDAFIEKPTVIENLRPYKIREIKGGSHHSIACTEDGKLLIWGRCDDGQAGIKLEDLRPEDLIFDSRGNLRILLKPTIIPEIQAVFVAAAIDNSIAIATDGKAYSWGYSDNYRTGLGTEESVKTPTLLQKGDVKGKRLTFAGCGGQFSVLAGPAEK
ncbi:RCC1/BLIP-II protein [Mollisia scopiformis]|uniref:RCC1/BLIP-II protein n=1 Tax=Mollisia scopiformis TaxID=149040 RepID=A0A132B4M2_MOLSC|nr:RCC1/BLIP-II protein [Mollisia scopiformis]KUJ07352.1 RCC1/BLIP-II protein [Mollisia scopiformis]